MVAEVLRRGAGTASQKTDVNGTFSTRTGQTTGKFPGSEAGMMGKFPGGQVGTAGEHGD